MSLPRFAVTIFINFVLISVLISAPSLGSQSQPDCSQLLSVSPDDDRNGLVSSQVDLTVEALVEAYTRGIFPWQDLGFAAAWYSPPQRGVLQFTHYKPHKDTLKALARGHFEITFDQAFAEVIEGCREAHAEKGEWISDRFAMAYSNLYLAGLAHSVEVWTRNPETHQRELAGGVYGTYIRGVFTGESMFRNRSLGKRSDNASRAAIHALIERLKFSGHTWIDTQMVTDATAALGATMIPRETFQTWLKESQNSERDF